MQNDGNVLDLEDDLISNLLNSDSTVANDGTCPYDANDVKNTTLYNPVFYPYEFLMNPFMITAPVLQQEQFTNAPYYTNVSDQSGSSNSTMSDSESSPSNTRGAKRGKRTPEQVKEDEQRYEALCKKRNEELTKEEANEKKKLRNRITAKESRIKKQRKLESAEREISILKKENAMLKKRVKELEEENRKLKSSRENPVSTSCEVQSEQMDGIFSFDDQMVSEEIQKFFHSSTEPSNPISVQTKLYIFAIFISFAFFVFGFSTLSSTFANLHLMGRNKFSGKLVPETAPHYDPVQMPALLYRTEEMPIPPRTRQLLQIPEINLSTPEITMDKAPDPIIDNVVAESPLTTKESKIPMLSFNTDHMEKKSILLSIPVNRSYGKDLGQRPSDIDKILPEDAEVEESNARQLALIPLALSSRKPNKMIYQYSLNNIYQKGTLYTLPTEEEETNDKDTVRIFCPNIYPMIYDHFNKDKASKNNETMKETIENKKYLKFSIPIGSEELVGDDGKLVEVIRIAEIQTNEIKMNDAYLVFPAVTAKEM